MLTVVLCFFQKSSSVMEMYREVGLPPKQKISVFRVSSNAVIKPGNVKQGAELGVYFFNIFSLIIKSYLA